MTTECAINILLSDDCAPITYRDFGDIYYKCALVNTQEIHSVKTDVERILFKLSIMDMKCAHSNNPPKAEEVVRTHLSEQDSASMPSGSPDGSPATVRGKLKPSAAVCAVSLARSEARVASLQRELHGPLRKPTLPAIESDAAAIAVGRPKMRQRRHLAHVALPLAVKRVMQHITAWWSVYRIGERIRGVEHVPWGNPDGEHEYDACRIAWAIIVTILILQYQIRHW